ncbi:MAG: hypothetical protein ACYDA2_08335 [Acidimicrobiales bacterium]
MTEAERQWTAPARSEPRWPASLAVLGALGLYLVLPERVTGGLGPRWLVPAVEVALGGALLVASPRRHSKESSRLRVAAIVLIAFVNLANVVNLGELIHALLYSTRAGNNGLQLVYASVPIWLTNVLVFGLWYWELDRGGPGARLEGTGQPDFLFPQMANPHCSTEDWTPSFLDYLYVSFTNATAFSPTDTMPLTPWAKVLMMLQSFASLLTVALVISRAVNVLH